MKKTLFATILLAIAISCNNTSSGSTTNHKIPKVAKKDSIKLAATKSDSTKRKEEDFDWVWWVTITSQ